MVKVLGSAEATNKEYCSSRMAFYLDLSHLVLHKLYDILYYKIKDPLYLGPNNKSNSVRSLCNRDLDVRRFKPTW